tara:strand:- start:9176 stop:9559 length:384 start_codon:yes stop_codon:yes gene_type:complete
VAASAALSAASNTAASLSLTCPACAAPAWVIIVNAVSVVVVVVTARLSLVDARATTPDLFSAFANDFVAFVARSAHRGAAYIVLEDARVITAHGGVRSGRARRSRARAEVARRARRGRIKIRYFQPG